MGKTEAIAIQSPEIGDRSIPPERGVELRFAGRRSASHNFSRIVKPSLNGKVSPERAQIGKHSVIPKERMDNLVPRKSGYTGYLASIVHTLRRVHGDQRPTERPEIRHFPLSHRKACSVGT